MKNTWITSDWHLGENRFDLMFRPFKSTDEHNFTILNNHNKLVSQDDTVYLVGDAAAQVKTSTHGGIIPGMIAARELSIAITEDKDYEKLWKKKIGKDLMIHLAIRKVMDNFKGKDCDKLVRLMKQEKVKTLVEEFDREFPSKYALKMVLREPRFLKFAIKYFT